MTRGAADSRSDIYALGIMLYEMLTGEQPYKGEQPMQIAYQHANDSVPAPSAAVSGVPPELDELVAWSTARDPEDRPATPARCSTTWRATSSVRPASTAPPCSGPRTAPRSCPRVAPARSARQRPQEPQVRTRPP